MTLKELNEFIHRHSTRLWEHEDYELRFAGHPGEQYSSTIAPNWIDIDRHKKQILIWLQ